MGDKATITQVSAAAIALLTGLLIYIVDRQADVYLLPGAIALTTTLPPLFGSLGAHLPSFLHVYAFTLLTVACLPPRRALALPVCVAWLAIECFFEAGQHASLATFYVSLVPAWFDGMPFLEASAGFFLDGHFDSLDILAAALGALAAWLTVRLTWTTNHEHA